MPSQASPGLVRTLQNGLDRSVRALRALPKIQARTLSVLNGVMGDTLHSRNSEWAIPMSLLGKPKSGKVCVLVHGLCDSETTWQAGPGVEPDYGRLLQRELHYSPLYLRYNSGLHISTNGQLLSGHLEQMVKSSTVPIREIAFIGHSLGGLIVRSACHYGEKAGAEWVKKVKKVFFLGTPHLGSDWEKLGHLTSLIMGRIPNFFTRGFAYLGNRRSAAIKDLRFGYILDEDWMQHDPNLSLKSHRHSVPLMDGVEYFSISACIAKNKGNFFTEYFGDGLVPPRSAMGKSFVEAKSLALAPQNYIQLRGLSHGDLARHPKVYRQILKWFRQGVGRRSKAKKPSRI